MTEPTGAPKLASITKEQLQRLLQVRAQKGLEVKRQPTKMPRTPDGCYPLSNAQQRFWFLEQLDENHALYNNPVYAVLSLSEPFDVALLERTFTEIVARHEIFRTAFTTKEGIPHQKIEPRAVLPFAYEDLCALPDEDKEAYLLHVALQEAAQTIPLDKPPLMRLRILRTGHAEYLFLYTPHHIISDGWSNAQLLKEQFTIYRELQLRGAHTLPPPPQFIDYVAWEQAWLASDECKASESYWRNMLRTIPPNLALPTDKPRPQVFTGRGKKLSLPVGAALTEAINRHCQRENVTPFSFFLAALNILLYRYSHQPDIVVGVPVANRTVEEFQNVFGLLLNTIPFKTSVCSEQTFAELEQQLKEQSYNSLKHQQVPFDRILAALKVERNLQTTPLFQVLFVFQNIPSLYSVGNISVKPYKVDLSITKYDLNFWVEEYNGEFVLTLTANTDVFSDKMVERILAHYALLVGNAAQNPLLPVKDMPMLTEEDKQTIFGALQASSPKLQEAVATFNALFETSASSAPERVAVASHGEQLTYRQLSLRANQLANLLLQTNKNRAPVAILLSRGVAQIVALLATIKSGVPCVPIAPDLPVERLRFILADCKASLLITEAKFRDVAAQLPLTALLLDEQAPHLAQCSAAPPTVSVLPSDLAYIIYTSGTTGAPKGVCIPHSALASYVQAITVRLGLEPGKRYATVSTLAADLGNTMIYPALALAGTLLIPTEDEITSPPLLAQCFAKTPPHYLKIVPSHLNALLSGGAAVLPSTAIIFGGEALSQTLVARVKALAPALQIFNHYGPTEATVGVAACQVQGSEPEIPIGKPLSSARLYILDPDLQPLPIGVEGEIFIGGQSLASGYLNNPDLTREKFVEAPFLPNEKLFKTGDRGAVDSEGRFFFRGRMDRQVKIRGNRVELREVELQLQALAPVQQAVALTPSEKTQGQLWAAITLSTPAEAAALRQMLAARLPAYMLPDRLIPLPQIPVTPNGKVDYEKTAQLLSSAKQPQAEAPQSAEKLTPDEERVKAIFCKVLQAEHLSLDDSFFSVGGNSLLAIELLHHIGKEFGVSLPLSFLFRNATIQKIGAGLRHQSTEFSPLVKMKDGGHGSKALFLVHPAGGNVFCYHTLASLLPGDVTIYGLQTRPGRVEQHDIKALSAQYLESIERHNITGSLAFGGWSMGALIAFEMAVQRSRKTSTCPNVLIIDQLAYADPPATPPDDVARIVLFAEKVEHMVGESLRITRQKIEGLSAQERSALFLEKFQRLGLAPQGITANEFHGFLEQMIYHNEIAAAYHPTAYDGNVLVVRSENPLHLRSDATTYADTRPADLRWRTFAPRATLTTSPGNHVSMMRSPYVEALAQKIAVEMLH
ncbi:MAG: amino acid adenylation domain-containing protein [Prevotellaceae bacterium]|jgi:amino acid adenylation domain-containing protein|nr:amino acid adenylation domain-containing protein [Prevotellaceae bacterium]